MEIRKKLILSSHVLVGLILGGIVLEGVCQAAGANSQIASPPPGPPAAPPASSKPQLAAPPAPADAGVLGMAAYNKRDFESARKLLAVACAEKPQDGDYQAVLGYLLARDGQYDEALPHLEKALTLRPVSLTPTDSRMNLGKALLMRPIRTDADTVRAITLFEQAAELSPRSEPVQLILGYGYARATRYDKAEVAYRRATEIAPTDPTAWKALGLTLRKTGPAGEAIAALKKASELNGSDSEVWENLGDAYLDRAETPAALAAFEAGRKAAPNDAVLLIRLANLYLRLSRFSEAADAYGAAANRMDADPTAVTDVSLGTLRSDQGAALSKAGRLNEAEDAYEKALTVTPNSADVLVNSGSLLFKQGKFDAATGRFRKATELQPSNTLAWKNLAVAATQSHDRDLAASAWRHVIQLDGSSYEARDMLADILILQNPVSDEPIKLYHQMAHLRPQSPDPLISLGLQYQRQAEAASLASTKQAKLLLAMTSFMDAIRRDVHSAPAYNDLGVVHERRGELPEAVAAYKKAIALDPGLLDARQNLARFANGATAPSAPPPAGHGPTVDRSR